MERQDLIRLVVGVVVLAALVRWIPGDRKDPLGRGAPWRALEIDRQVAAYGDDVDGARALLRPSNRGNRQQSTARWRHLLRQVRAIQARADEDTLVQIKGMPRNDLFPIVYDLFPVRTTLRTYEDGSRPDDETLPEATDTIVSQLVPFEELTRAEFEAIRRRQRAADPGDADADGR